MKFPSLHKGVIVWTGVSLVCALLLAGLMFKALQQKAHHAERAELAGHKVVIGFADQNVISKPYNPAALKLKVSAPAPKEVSSASAPAAGGLQINKEGKPKIVIIIGGLGLSASSTERALKLPPAVTFGFSPYAADAKKWVDLAIKQQHDILINLPMEPVNYPIDDPGPYALLKGLSEMENTARLGMVLAKYTSVGVYGSPNEGFSLATKKMQPILDSLKGRNLLFVYGGTTATMMLQQLATSNGLPVVANDVQLDKDIASLAIEGRLAELEKIARTKGYAIAIGNPYPVTIKVLENWMSTLESKGLQVVPISALFTNFRNKDSQIGTH